MTDMTHESLPQKVLNNKDLAEQITKYLDNKDVGSFSAVSRGLNEASQKVLQQRKNNFFPLTKWTANPLWASNPVPMPDGIPASFFTEGGQATIYIGKSTKEKLIITSNQINNSPPMILEFTISDGSYIEYEGKLIIIDKSGDSERYKIEVSGNITRSIRNYDKPNTDSFEDFKTVALNKVENVYPDPCVAVLLNIMEHATAKSKWAEHIVKVNDIEYRPTQDATKNVILWSKDQSKIKLPQATYEPYW